VDKKDKKRLEVLRQKVEKTRKLIAAAQAQPDDPHELNALQQQMVELQKEIDELKSK
jgi:Spy/CpxP family protein refolding chaperone